MNMKCNPNIDELRTLIRRCDDTTGNHVFWVKRNGDVELSRIPNDQSLAGFEKAHPEMQIRFEVFQAGNEYVGPEAASDSEWVAELYDNLVEKWRQGNGRSEIVYADAF